MNKKIYVLVLVVIFIIISNLVFKTKKIKEKEIFEPNFTFPFYKEKLKEEYQKYKEETGLSLKESIIRVNIGLNHPFYENTKQTIDKGILTLVNKYNYVSKDYVPKDLITINEIKINKEAYASYKEMKEELSKEGLNIRIISAYRSYIYQKALYETYLRYDKKEIVDTYSARPGYSEHHTGLAIDIDNGIQGFEQFYLTKEFIWMQENAYKYGFILRYPKDKENITGYKYEPWHYRYVGKEIAKYIKKHNISFEEYYYEFIID